MGALEKSAFRNPVFADSTAPGQPAEGPRAPSPPWQGLQLAPPVKRAPTLPELPLPAHRKRNYVSATVADA